MTSTAQEKLRDKILKRANIWIWSEANTTVAAVNFLVGKDKLRQVLRDFEQLLKLKEDLITQQEKTNKIVSSSDRRIKKEQSIKRSVELFTNFTDACELFQTFLEGWTKSRFTTWVKPFSNNFLRDNKRWNKSISTSNDDIPHIDDVIREHNKNIDQENQKDFNKKISSLQLSHKTPKYKPSPIEKIDKNQTSALQSCEEMCDTDNTCADTLAIGVSNQSRSPSSYTQQELSTESQCYDESSSQTMVRSTQRRAERKVKKLEFKLQEQEMKMTMEKRRLEVEMEMKLQAEQLKMQQLSHKLELAKLKENDSDGSSTDDSRSETNLEVVSKDNQINLGKNDGHASCSSNYESAAYNDGVVKSKPKYKKCETTDALVLTGEQSYVEDTYLSEDSSPERCPRELDSRKVISSESSPERDNNQFHRNDSFNTLNQSGNNYANNYSANVTPMYFPGNPQPFYVFPAAPPAETMGFQRSLPKWKLNLFSGDPLEWPEWSGMFLATVGRCNISKDEKMNHLKTLVTGKAKEVVAGFGYSGAFYDSAWKKLEKTFGRPHVIVGSQLAKIQNHPPIKIHDSESIIKYARSVATCVEVLTTMKYKSDLKSSTNVESVLRKLPPNMRERWHRNIESKRIVQPTLIQLSDWLDDEASVHSEMIAMNHKEGIATSNSKTNSSKGKHQSFSSQTDQNPPITKCGLCSEKHPLWACAQFKKLSPKDRYEKVKAFKLCFLCLRGGHPVKDCKLKECGIDGCDKRHNRMLHIKVPNSNSTDPNQKEVSHSNNISRDTYGAVPVYQICLTNENTSIKCWALADDGASMSWIDQDLAKTLGLSGVQHNFVVNSFNGPSNIESEIVSVSISPTQRVAKFYSNVEMATHPKLSIGSNVYEVQTLKENYPHLRSIPYRKLCLKDIKVILGQNLYNLIRPLEYASDPKAESSTPFAIRSQFGWTLAGPLPKGHLRGINCTNQLALSADTELANQIKHWWDIESYGTRVQVDGKSREDKRSLQIMREKTFFDGERYTIPMLWHNEQLPMPNNYFPAFKQFLSLEKRLNKDVELKEAYSKTIEKDLQLGFVRIISREELLKTKEQKQWYLPHHPVVNPNKPGKVRRVCNAASEHHGVSLNSHLMTGPDLLLNLVGMILRFREEYCALSADIESMFLQVKVPDSDAKCLRFIWRKNSDDVLKIYEYTRHIFGAKSSPTCASYALQRTISDNESSFPVSALKAKSSFYMDDFIISCPSKEEALELKKDTIKLTACGGFNLTKWVSNIVECCDPETWNSTSTTSVLGIQWNYKEDTLQLCRGFNKCVSEPFTHRKVLSTASSIFDPIGISSPYSIRVRLILRRIWQEIGNEWDDPLPTDIAKDFQNWLSELEKIQEKKRFQDFTDVLN